MSDLPTIIQNLQELARLQQLNFEILEELGILLDYIEANHIQVPNRDKFNSMLAKTHALLKELYFSSDKVMPYRKLNRRKVTAFRTDKEVTEPVETIYRGVKIFPSASEESVRLILLLRVLCLSTKPSSCPTFPQRNNL